MFPVGIDFLDRIYNEDVIFHYTKASTAIDYILYDNQLKFSNRKVSIDPIEGQSAYRRTILQYKLPENVNRDSFYSQCDNLERYVNNLENSFLQISFCKNHIDKSVQITQLEGNEELFGFTKPRMWERYADNYQGVCLAFSKKKLLDKNSRKLDLIINDVKYYKYLELCTKKIGNISGDYLIKNGIERYIEKINHLSKESFFCKHIDYAGENEFRIGTYFDKNKCVFEIIRGEYYYHNTMMLDTKNTVEALFVSNYVNRKQMKSLYKYARDLNIPLIEIIWNHDSFKTNDYIKYKIFLKNLNDSSL